MTPWMEPESMVRRLSIWANPGPTQTGNASKLYGRRIRGFARLGFSEANEVVVPMRWTLRTALVASWRGPMMGHWTEISIATGILGSNAWGTEPILPKAP